MKLQSSEGAWLYNQDFQNQWRVKFIFSAKKGLKGLPLAYPTETKWSPLFYDKPPIKVSGIKQIFGYTERSYRVGTEKDKAELPLLCLTLSGTSSRKSQMTGVDFNSCKSWGWRIHLEDDLFLPWRIWQLSWSGQQRLCEAHTPEPLYKASPPGLASHSNREVMRGRTVKRNV